MKKILKVMLLLSLLIILSGLSNVFGKVKSKSDYLGVVMVYETPLFSSPSLDSRIIEYYLRGDHIFIHPIHFDELKKGVKGSGDFYESSSSSGIVGYVLKKHIFLLTGDISENENPIFNYSKVNDPTDYRLKEPLPENFPFKNSKDQYKFMSLAGYSPLFSSHKSYSFKGPPPSSHESSLPLDLAFVMKRTFDFDLKRRLFIGGGISIRNNKEKYYFSPEHLKTQDESLTGTKESTYIGIGPYTSLLFWESSLEKYSGSLFFWPLFSLYHKTSLKFNDRLNSYGVQYERSGEYLNYDLSLSTGGYISLNNSIPFGKVLFGLKFLFSPLFTLKQSQPFQNDGSSEKGHFSFTIFLGLQTPK